MRAAILRPLATALALAALLLAPGLATAAPVISGADGDAWNAAEVPASYVITGSALGATLSWQLLSEETAVPGFSGSGVSPLTVTLTGAPEGEMILVAVQNLPLDPDRAARAFSIDTTPPAITVVRPGAGAVYQRKEKVLADYSCGDATTCTGTVPVGAPIDTATTGTKTFSINAVNAAGNTAARSVEYRVTTAPPPPIQTLTLPPDPGGGDSVFPVSNPSRLKPPAGGVLLFRRPVLRWTRVGAARLYNLQVFRVKGNTATKILSRFPLDNRYRVPRGTLAWGDRYIWRVWPLVKGSYTKKPHGQSWFEVRRPVRLTSSQLLVNQRISQAALRRTAAVADWLDAGLVTGDLRDGSLAREDFAADVNLTGAGGAIDNGVAVPRPIPTGAAPSSGRARIAVTATQLLVNQRISQAAVRRANALAQRIGGGLTGGDLSVGAVEAAKLAPGLVVASAQPAGPGPPASRSIITAAKPRRASSLQMTDRQALINQRISQAAVRRANSLVAAIESGLTGANFRNGAISAISISPALR